MLYDVEARLEGEKKMLSEMASIVFSFEEKISMYVE
jgi:hypothetical protein